jgi:putative membrane protein
MNRVGPVLAIAGVALAAYLFATEDVHAILALLELAGGGLLIASAVHVFPMMLNARAWQYLFAPGGRPSFGSLLWATWARESVNTLLPVMRIGGEIVAYRMVRRSDVPPVDVAAALVVDMALSMLTQALFTLAGLALLMLHGVARDIAVQLAIAGVLLVALGAAFVAVQRAGIASAGARLLHRLAGRFEDLIAGSERIDAAIGAIYARRRDIARCALWQCAGWVAGAAEIWLALYFLGQPRPIVDALIIDALIQAISSVAFVIPGALGVQEGGFLLLGALIGLDGSSALALAAARRVRDVVVYFPGLAGWHWAEVRIRRDASRA